MTALEHTLHAALIQAAKIISDHGAASLAQRAQIFAALQQGFDAGGNHADNDHHRSSGGNASGFVGALRAYWHRQINA